jgi:hypothetical protein
MQTTSENPHLLATLIWVNDKLCNLRRDMPVKMDGALTEALGRLSSFPFMYLNFETDNSDKFSIAGEAAGTFEAPDIDLILKKSIASPFGKDDKMVMDESYRKGREIPASDIKFDTCHAPTYQIESIISRAMFLNRRVKVQLYKLAIYQDGGHFDWHMDSTHSDKHHATVLLALNTSWVGGDLVVRHNGMETCAEMQPGINKKSNTILQAVAFYTDTEHKVEPVTKGMWIVLQFDVEVAGWNQEEKGDSALYYGKTRDMLYNAGTTSSKRKFHIGATPDVGNPELLEEIKGIIEKLLKSSKDVAFALQYLYQKSSILPEFRCLPLSGTCGIL